MDAAERKRPVSWVLAMVQGLLALALALSGCGYTAGLRADYGADDEGPPTLTGEILIELPRTDLLRAFNSSERLGSGYAFAVPGRLDDVIDWRIDQLANRFTAPGVRVVRRDRLVNGTAMVGMLIVLDAADGTRSSLFPGQLAAPLRKDGRRLQLRLDNPLRDAGAGYGPGGMSDSVARLGTRAIPRGSVTVSFPGRIVSTNGTAHGREVSWDLTGFRGATLRATADPPIDWRRWAPVLGLGAGAAVLAAGYAVWRRLRPGPAPVAEPGPTESSVDPVTGETVYRASAWQGP